MSRRFFSYMVIGLAIVFIVLGFVSPFLVRNFVVIDELKLNEITTWLTGCMSVCFSLSSICLVIVTLNINSGNEKIHQFQNRFFKWYEIFCSVKENISNDYLLQTINELDNKLRTIDYTILASDSLRDIIYDTCKLYGDIYEKEKYRLGEYITCLFNLICFIDKENVEQKEKEFCVSFLRANLSILEKKIIFYHSFCNIDRKKFHDIIEKYNLLVGLEARYLVEGQTIIDLYYKKIYD